MPFTSAFIVFVEPEDHPGQDRNAIVVIFLEVLFLVIRIVKILVGVVERFLGY